VENFPNSINVIPRRTVFSVEFRHPDVESLERMESGLFEKVGNIGTSLGLCPEVRKVLKASPLKFNAGQIDVVRRVSSRLGLTHMDIVSGAGHDAVNMARIAPASMIFIPCVGGLSHVPEEDFTLSWAENGANVLLYAIMEKASDF
jgi:N-carbamoyl-L-amino-acid hydrolase